jgi:acyl-CoA synthetase (AMP-forming)/AMP-acid ligase II
VATRQHVGFGELKEYSTHLSSILVKQYGLKERDVVAIYSKNSICFPIAALAAIRVGAIAYGASPDYNSDEFAYTLRLSKAKFVFAGPEVADNAYAAAADAGIPKDNVFLLDGVKGQMLSTWTLVDRGKCLGSDEQVPAWKLPYGKSNREVCGYLGFTSGTSGLSKGVMISHANITSQCVQVRNLTTEDHDRILAALPFYHITGIVHQLHLPLLINADVYVLPKFTLDGALKAAAEYKIKELLFVPPIIIRVVREPELVAKYDLAHVRRFSSGAAPLSQEILTSLEKMFPGTGFKQAYGMTETCSVVCIHPPDKYDFKYAHKVGILAGSTEMRLVDPDTGKDCGIDTPGELWIRGPQITMGYLYNQKATDETFDKDGFIHTGDVGSIDKDGFITITDRIKDMIKVKGVGVAPAELEDLLLGHPFVVDAAVCAIPDDRAGERPKAFVVLKQPTAGNPKEAAKTLLEFVRSKKSRNKRIAEIEIVDVIPKSAAGKILRRKLRNTKPSASAVVVREDAHMSKL